MTWFCSKKGKKNDAPKRKKIFEKRGGVCLFIPKRDYSFRIEVVFWDSQKGGLYLLNRAKEERKRSWEGMEIGGLNFSFFLSTLFKGKKNIL